LTSAAIRSGPMFSGYLFTVMMLTQEVASRPI